MDPSTSTGLDQSQLHRKWRVLCDALSTVGLNMLCMVFVRLWVWHDWCIWPAFDLPKLYNSRGDAICGASVMHCRQECGIHAGDR